MEIAEKLGLIQQLSRKTQKELASELGVSFPTLNSWINGKSTPRAKALEQIDSLYLSVTGQNVIPDAMIEAKKAALLDLRIKYPGVVKTLESNRQIFGKLSLALICSTNNLDGSTLTENETANILFNDAAFSNSSIIDQMLVKNHHAAFRYVVRHLAGGGTINEAFVLKLHETLTNGASDEAGCYRREALRIGGFNAAPIEPSQVPALMGTLMADITERGDKDLFDFLAHSYSRFEQIHPFAEGNGKTGRLLLAAMLLKEDFPPAIISPSKKRLYILYLNQSQREGNYSRLEDLICDAVMEGHNLLRTLQEPATAPAA